MLLGLNYVSLRNFLSKYVTNHAETSEKHPNKLLQTRYYKTTKDIGFKTLDHLFRNSALYEINAISKEHGEISVYVKKGKKAFIVATVIMVRPFRTAIDFSVTTETVLPFDFGYSTKLIERLYHELDKELPLLDRKQG